MSKKTVKKNKKSSILGTKVNHLTKPQVVRLVTKWLNSKRLKPKYIVTPNPEQVVQAQEDKEFRNILNQADLAIADGIGLVWASRRLGKPLPEKVSGVWLMEAVCNQAVKNGWRVMLIGGKKQVAQKAVEKIKQKYNLYNIWGWQGAIDIKNITPKGNQIMIDGVNQFKPDVLFVAYGAPYQEKWLAKNLDKLKIKVGVVVGGAFDQIAKPSMRPPKFMEKIHLGWFYRLVRQPWRIKRQLRLVKFVKMVLKNG